MDKEQNEHKESAEEMTTETLEVKPEESDATKGNSPHNMLEECLEYFLGVFTGTVLALYLGLWVLFLLVPLVIILILEFIFGGKDSDSTNNSGRITWYNIFAIFLGVFIARALFDLSPILTIVVGLMLGAILVKSHIDSAKKPKV